MRFIILYLTTCACCIRYCFIDYMVNDYWIMLHIILILIFFHGGWCCEPGLILPDTNVYEDYFDVITCNLRNQENCTIGLEYVSFYKEVDDEISEVFRIFPDRSFTAFNISDKYTLHGRSDGGISRNHYRLNIEPFIINDSGLWNCKAVHAEVEYPSSDDNFVVFSELSSNDINISEPDSILLGTPSIYTCDTTRVHPKPRSQWEINENIYDGDQTEVPNGIAWDIRNQIDFTFTNKHQIEVKCLIKRDLLNKSVSEKADGDNEIYAPATVENYTMSSHTNPTLSDILTLNCTASGTGVNIEWYHNDSILGPDLFTVSHDIIDGNFNYGEETANKSTIIWKPPIEPNCENIHLHNGQYECRAQAEKGDLAIADEKLTVDVYYSPIFISEDRKDYNVNVDDKITLECITCSNPKATNIWMSMNGHHDLIDQEGDFITIIVNDNDTIVCNASNQIGQAHAIFNIFANELPGLSTTWTPENDTTAEPSSNEALIIANAVIWSLCGVVAVVLVFLALYHYRQIQNGKKYREEYSEEIVLTDDEAKPGTSHVSSDYDDIHFSDRVVGGASNKGMYAEVQASSKTTISIAPQQVSKVKMSENNSSNPKLNQTQRSAAPNTPMNTRGHKPNSPLTDRRNDLAVDHSALTERKEMPQKHSNEFNHGATSKVEQQHKRHDSPNKPVVMKQNTNGSKPSLPAKPNITSFRSSRSSGLNSAGAPCDNAEVNLYANCEQRPVPKNGDGTITYADLALQQEDPYDEGAPPVPNKHMNEPVQYASIKLNK